MKKLFFICLLVTLVAFIYAKQPPSVSKKSVKKVKEEIRNIPESNAPEHIEKAFTEALEFIEQQKAFMSKEEYERDKKEMLEMRKQARISWSNK